eukprot:14890828-Alexandrium_andersonii.AAC.1
MQPSLRGSVTPEPRGTLRTSRPALEWACTRAHAPAPGMARLATPRAPRPWSAAPGAAPEGSPGPPSRRGRYITGP